MFSKRRLPNGTTIRIRVYGKLREKDKSLTDCVVFQTNVECFNVHAFFERVTNSLHCEIWNSKRDILLWGRSFRLQINVVHSLKIIKCQTRSAYFMLNHENERSNIEYSTYGISNFRFISIEERVEFWLNRKNHWHGSVWNTNEIIESQSLDNKIKHSSMQQTEMPFIVYIRETLVTFDTWELRKFKNSSNTKPAK